jgi:hypothetical protein
VGKLKKDGSLVVVDQYIDDYDHGKGWIVHAFRNFDAVLKAGLYDSSFDRALAHKLGIEKLRWNGIWLKTDDLLRDVPNDLPGTRKVQQLRASQLEAAGHRKAAAAFRKRAGLGNARESLSEFPDASPD